MQDRIEDAGRGLYLDDGWKGYSLVTTVAATLKGICVAGSFECYPDKLHCGEARG
jgi:hypothetical protein